MPNFRIQGVAMKISFSKIAAPARGVVVVTVAEAAAGKESKAAKNKPASGPVLGRSAVAIDMHTKGALRRAIKAAEFSGKREKTLQLLVPGEGQFTRVVLVGVGDPTSLDAFAAERLGAVIYDTVAREPSATVMLEGIDTAKAGAGELAAHVAGGARLKSYRFDKYRTKEDKDAKPKLKSIVIQCQKPAEAAKAHDAVTALVDGSFLTRDLVNEPANILYPESFANRAKSLTKDGITVEVLAEPALRRLGMGALLGVGQGSARPSRVLVMRWNGARDKSKAPVVLVGKGVCFDTGGISLKPPPGMWDMKWDMGGAGVVTGVMQTLARRKARVNVVGLCGLVENMPDA
ncbi:MAG: leucyl aminopeptidase, partial [Nitrospirae bacterium]